MNNEFVSSAFSTLCEVAEEHGNKQQNYGRTRVTDNDDEYERDSPHPLYDSFLETLKAQIIQKMTNFRQAEIVILFDCSDPIVGTV